MDCANFSPISILALMRRCEVDGGSIYSVSNFKVFLSFVENIVQCISRSIEKSIPKKKKTAYSLERNEANYDIWVSESEFDHVLPQSTWSTRTPFAGVMRSYGTLFWGHCVLGPWMMQCNASKQWKCSYQLLPSLYTRRSVHVATCNPFSRLTTLQKT